MTYVAKNTPEDVTASEPEKITNASSGSASFFDQLSPKSALVVGLVTSVLTLCSIGFVILLVLFTRSGR